MLSLSGWCGFVLQIDMHIFWDAKNTASVLNKNTIEIAHTYGVYMVSTEYTVRTHGDAPSSFHAEVGWRLYRYECIPYRYGFSLLPAPSIHRDNPDLVLLQLPLAAFSLN